MKKSLWILSALAMVGFAFTGCSNDCETADDCADGEFCIEALYAAAGGNDDTDSVEVGDMFCSACPVDCDPASQYPVCSTVAKACAAQATCPAGQQFQVNGNIATCISSEVKTCSSNADCEKEGYVCGPQNVCIPGAEDKFKFVRIDDLSPACQKESNGKCKLDDPGADIDAVALRKAGAGSPIYASRVVGYQRSDNVKAGERYDESTPLASDPSKATGAPDAFAAYPEKDGKCKLYSDSAHTAHTFVSLGGLGGYLILEMGGNIEAGDTLDVLEVGGCKMENTTGGKYDGKDAQSENIKVQVSVHENDGWKVVGDDTANTTNKGILSFTISDNMLK